MRIFTGIARALVKLALFTLFVWLFVRPFFLLVASFFTSNSPGLIRCMSEVMGMLLRAVLMYFGMSMLLSIAQKLQNHRFAQIAAGLAATAALLWFLTKGVDRIILWIAELMSLAVSILAMICVGAVALSVIGECSSGTLLFLALMQKDKDEDEDEDEDDL